MKFSFNFTKEHLGKMIGVNPHIDFWYSAICTILPDYGIDTKERLAAYIAQCGHESGNFKMLRENLNYSAQGLMSTWPSRFPTLTIANQYARNPEKIANKVYANRMGNGDEASGDGWKYIGRGLIQLTGKENYSWFAASIEAPLETLAEYLSTFEGAVQSACWYWESNSLNKWVDAGDFDGLSDVINIGRKTEKVGDSIGYADRLKHYKHAISILQ